MEVRTPRRFRMPLFEVTFMNHITDTYVVDVEDDDAAWE